MDIICFIFFCIIDLSFIILAVILSKKDNRKYKRLLESDTGEVLFDIKYKKKKLEKIYIILLGILFLIDKAMTILIQSSGTCVIGITLFLLVLLCIKTPEIYIFSDKIKYKQTKGYGGKEGEAYCDEIASITVTDKTYIISTLSIELKSQEQIDMITSPKALLAAEEFCKINNIKLNIIKKNKKK